MRGVSVKEWRRVENIVNWFFVTRCSDDRVEVEMETGKVIDVLKFFIGWEVTNSRRDVIININGKEFIFRGCKASVSDIKDFSKGNEARITVIMMHSGIELMD